MDAIKRNRAGLALALAAAGALGAQAAVAAPKKVPAAQPQAGHPCGQAAGRAAVVRNVPLPRKRPLPAAAASAPAPSKVALRGSLAASPAMFRPLAHPPSGRFEPAPAASAAATSPDDIAAVKRVIEAARKGKEADADAAENSIARSGRPQARRMGRSCAATTPSRVSQRYAAFVNANPSWPHAPLFRRRAENALWNDKRRRRRGARLFRQP